MKTTLNKIQTHSPCEDGWDKLLLHLSKTSADDEPLDLLTILDSNGLEDTLWALRAVDGYDRELRLYACWCACQVLPVFERKNPNELRPRRCIETSALYAEGLADKSEMVAAGAAAWVAAWAAWAAWYAWAAWVAAGAAAGAAWAAWADWDAAGAAWAKWDVKDNQKREFKKMLTEGHDYMRLADYS